MSSAPIVLAPSRRFITWRVVLIVFLFIIFAYSQIVLGKGSLVSLIAGSPFGTPKSIILIILTMGALLVFLSTQLASFTTRIVLDAGSITYKNCFSRSWSSRYDEIEKVELCYGRGRSGGQAYLTLIPQDKNQKGVTIPIHILPDREREILGKLFKDKIDKWSI